MNTKNIKKPQNVKNTKNIKKNNKSSYKHKKSSKIEKIEIEKKLVLIGILLILILIATFVTVNCNKATIKLKTFDPDVIEYGENYSINLYNLLDFNGLSSNQIESIKNRCEVSDNFKNEKSKTYPAIGTYKVYLKYGNQVVCKKVNVKDTTPPNLILNKDSFEILQNTFLDLYDFGQFYDSKDKSITMTYCDTSSINSKIPGYYKMKVISKDTSGNETIKEVSVKVKTQQTNTVNNISSKTSKSSNVSNSDNKNNKKSNKNKYFQNHANSEKSQNSSNNSSNNDKNDNNENNEQNSNNQSNQNDQNINNSENSNNSNSSNNENSDEENNNNNSNNNANENIEIE